MKKWVWVILVLFVALFSWTTPQKEAEEVTLEWMQWMYGDDAKIYAGVIEEFESANPGIKVSITEFSYQDHYSNLEVRMAGDNAPDIFRNEYGFLMRYEKNDQVVDLKPDFPSNYWNGFWPKLMEFCDINDGVYGVPQMTDTTVVFYNKDLFKKAGVTAPTRVEDAWDWDDWERIGRKLKAAGAKYGMAGATYGGTVWYYVSWDGGFVSPDGSKPYMNRPGVIEGLKKQKKWFDDELEPISTLWFNPDNFEVLFSQGQIGMIWSGIWMTTFMDQNVKDFDWGVTFCPGGPGGFGLHLGGCVNSISTQSAHSKEAAKFLEYFTREKSMDAYCQQGYIPADVDLADSIVYKNPAVAKTMKVANEAYGELSPMIVTQYKAPNLYSMYQAVMEDLGPYFLGQVGVDEAVAKLEKDITDIMKQ